MRHIHVYIKADFSEWRIIRRKQVQARTSIQVPTLLQAHFVSRVSLTQTSTILQSFIPPIIHVHAQGTCSKVNQNVPEIRPYHTADFFLQKSL